MKITAITSIKYEDEALEGQYRSRVDKFVEKLLEKVANGEDAGNSLGMHTETWYPDASAKVDVNIQPGVTSPIIRVRVRRVEEKPTGEEKPKKKKEGTGYIPYLWVGVAAYDHEWIPSNLFGGLYLTTECVWGSPVRGLLYGIEPLQQGESYRLSHGVESNRGWACYFGYYNYDSFYDQVYASIGDAADGTQPFYNIPLAWACNSDQFGFYIEGTPATCNPENAEAYVYAHECSILNDGVFVLGDPTTLHAVYCGALYSGTTHSALRSVNNMYCIGALGTQMYAPDEAWAGGLPKDFWTESILVDPDGSEIRDDAAPNGQMIYRWGSTTGYGYRYSNVNFTGEVLKSTLLPGLYRIDVAAQGMECDTWNAKIRVRMVLGKAGVVPSTDPERIGEVDIATPEVVDFYCEGIGSNVAQTVTNNWYLRSLVMSGAHPYENIEKFNEPDTWGPNPGYPENPGFWSQSLYVDVKNGNWALGEFKKEFPFWDNAHPIVFNSCECAVNEGEPCWGNQDTAPSPVTSQTWRLYDTVTCGNSTNINGGFAFQLAEVAYRCDDYLLVRLRGDLGRCSGGVPCFGEGGCEMAVQMFSSEDLRTQRQAGAGETDLHVGEIVMVTAVSMDLSKLGVARLYPSWMGQWWSELRCPNTQWWQAFIRHTQDRGRSAVRVDESGACVPSPIYWKYNIAGRGFDG